MMKNIVTLKSRLGVR